MCKVDFCKIKTDELKVDTFDVSSGAVQRRNQFGDSLIDLVIENLESGIACYITSICVKTKYSNWSESMNLKPEEARVNEF